jgi:hypothetical protein
VTGLKWVLHSGCRDSSFIPAWGDYLQHPRKITRRSKAIAADSHQSRWQRDQVHGKREGGGAGQRRTGNRDSRHGPIRRRRYRHWHFRSSADRPFSALGEALRWPVGLERKAKEAKEFYAALALSTLVGWPLTSRRWMPSNQSTSVGSDHQRDCGGPSDLLNDAFGEQAQSKGEVHLACVPQNLGMDLGGYYGFRRCRNASHFRSIDSRRPKPKTVYLHFTRGGSSAGMVFFHQ